MVKSRTEVIIAINDSENDAERAKFLLIFFTCFHFVFLLSFLAAGVFGAYAILNLTEEQKREPLFAMMKMYLPLYGTNWNAAFQTTFLCLALAHDVLQWLDKHESNLGKKIKYFRDIIFNGLVFPFTCFVTGMFWGLYVIDRELVFPRVYDQIVPWWLNHCVHTNIFVVIAVETILTRRRHPTDSRVEGIMCGFVSVFYAVVYYSIFFFGGVWLYGVFGIMTWWQVCLYQAGIWFSTWIFYRMSFIINRMIHKKEIPVVRASKANGDLESKETTFSSKNGASSEHANASGNETNGVKDGKVKDDGKADLPSGSNTEGEKQWKSHGANVIHEDGNVTDQPFDKSWSTKYRTNRNQFEKSSL